VEEDWASLGIMVRRCRSDVGRAKPSVAIGAVKYIAQMDSRRNMLLILERRNYGQEATGSYLKATTVSTNSANK